MAECKEHSKLMQQLQASVRCPCCDHTTLLALLEERLKRAPPALAPKAAGA